MTTKKKIRKATAGLWPALALLLVSNGARAQGQIGDLEELCLPSTGYLELQARCLSGEPADENPSPKACAWLPVLDAWWDGDTAAGKTHLRRAFPMPGAHLEALAGAATMFTPLLLESMACMTGSTPGLQLVFRSSFGRVHIAAPAGFEVLAALTDLDPRALAALPRRGGEGWPEVERAARGFAELVQESVGKARLRRLMMATPMIGRDPRLFPKLQVWHPRLVDLAPHLEALDRVLESSMDLAPGLRFRRLSQAVSTLPTDLEPVESPQTLAWARIGSGLLTLGRPIEAWTALTWSESFVRQNEPDETSLQAWIGFAVKTQKLMAAAYLGLTSEILRLAAEMQAAPAERRALTEALLAPLTAPNTRAALSTELGRLDSLQLNGKDADTFWLAWQLVVPGMAGSAEAVAVASAELDGGSVPCGQPILTTAVIEAWKVHGIRDGLAEWRRFVRVTPHWDHAVWPVQMAKDAWQKGDPKTALLALDTLLNFFERDLDPLWAAELVRAAIDDTVFRFYPAAVDLALGFGAHPAEAFHVAERGRAYTLRRLLGAPRGGSEHVSAEEARLEPQIIAGLVPTAVSPDSRSQARGAKLDQKIDDFASARLRRKSLDLELEFPKFPAPVSLATLQREILGENETLLAYFPGVERPHVWVVRRDGLWHRHLDEPSMESRELAPAVEILRRQGEADDDGAAERLYRRLIEPVEAHLRPGTLFIVPFGPLHRVPWSALRGAAGRRLVRDHTLAVLPSADALATLRARRESETTRDGTAAPSHDQSQRVLILGDPVSPLPRLDGARREARAVAELFGVEPRLRGHAREADFLQEAPRARLIHLAAHGVYEPEHALFSRLHLSADAHHDGVLTVHEIWDRLQLDEDPLVVLSACSAAAGKPSKGDDIVGLTQAFLVAGSPTVISTLWPVDDTATASLMAAFYEHYRAGHSAGESLHRAQTRLLDDPSTTLPDDWAAFILTGDPDTRWDEPVSRRRSRQP